MEQAFATKRAVQLADIAKTSSNDPIRSTRSCSAATEAPSIILVPRSENELIGSMAASGRRFDRSTISRSGC